MSRIAEYASVLSGASSAALAGEHPADASLRSLLVHLAFSDGQVDASEFDLLQRLLPEQELGALLVWVDAESKRPLDLAGLRSTFPSPEDRRELIALAEAMAALDGHVHAGERRLLDKLRALVGG